MDEKIFQSGKIIGIYNEQLNEEDAWKIGYAAGRFLPSLVTGYERGQAKAQCVCVGHDMRTHSESLTAKLIEGIQLHTPSVT